MLLNSLEHILSEYSRHLVRYVKPNTYRLYDVPRRRLVQCKGFQMIPADIEEIIMDYARHFECCEIIKTLTPDSIRIDCPPSYSLIDMLNRLMDLGGVSGLLDDKIGREYFMLTFSREIRHWLHISNLIYGSELTSIVISKLIDV